MELAARPKWKKRSSSRKSNLRISLKSLSHGSSPSRQRSSYLTEFKVVDNNVKVDKPTFVSADEGKDLPPVNIPFGPKDVPGTPTEELSDEPFEVVEEQPEFPGGLNAFRQYLQDHLRYPESAQDAGIQGKVMIRFVVERDGSATAVEVYKSVDPALDKEAVRVVKSIPKWKPGKQQGKAVRTRYVIPIVFSLQ